MLPIKITSAVILGGKWAFCNHRPGSETSSNLVSNLSIVSVFDILRFFSMYNKAYNAAAQMCYHYETKHHANEGYIGCKYAFSHQSIYNWIIYQIYNQ